MVFDSKVALQGMGNDTSLLHETLQDFIDYYGDAGEKIRSAVAEGHHHDAEILAHTIKGLGGTFAAPYLRESALVLERALHGGELEGLDQKVDDVDRAIAEMVGDISRFLRA